MTPATPRNAVFFVIVILGIVAVGGLMAITWLAHDHVAVPIVLQNVTVSAVTAVATLLASTRAIPNDPPPPAV